MKRLLANSFKSRYSNWVGAKNKNNFRSIIENFELLLLTIPAILYFTIFHYIPMCGLVLAFKNFRYEKGIFGSPWVGFDNFKFFFTSQDAWRITRNTVAYSAVFIICGIVSAVIVALLLFELNSRLAIKMYQTTMILPHFLSWVLVGYISYVLLDPINGILNQVLKQIGWAPVDWYTQPQYWPFILTMTNIWKGVGMNTIIYYAALVGVDKSLYEAAEIDGANRLQQTWHVSIPALVPLMVILSILGIGGLFRGDFGLFYQIPRNVGLLYPVTDIIDTYVYRGLRQGSIGITAAVGFFQSVFGLILVIFSNMIARKINSDNSLF